MCKGRLNLLWNMDADQDFDTRYICHFCSRPIQTIMVKTDTQAGLTALLEKQHQQKIEIFNVLSLGDDCLVFFRKF